MSSDVDFEDLPETKQGRNGERIVIDFLERNGWGCVNTSRASGDGPAMLTSVDDDTVIQDLQVSRNGVSRWVEVKAKDPDDPQEERGYDDVLQQGIEIGHWDDYLTVQDRTGIDAWAFFYEPELGTLCTGSMRWMDQNIHRSTRKFENPPKHYWRRKDLRIVDPNGTPEDGAFGDDVRRGWL